MIKEIIGKTKKEAQKWASDNGYTLRLRKEDGKSFMGTMDFRKDRINISVEKGKVVEATIG